QLQGEAVIVDLKLGRSDVSDLTNVGCRRSCHTKPPTGLVDARSRYARSGEVRTGRSRRRPPDEPDQARTSRLCRPARHVREEALRTPRRRSRRTGTAQHAEWPATLSATT